LLTILLLVFRFKDSDYLFGLVWFGLGFMVFNGTFNNISAGLRGCDRWIYNYLSNQCLSPLML
jgi:hypothetical protein